MHTIFRRLCRLYDSTLNHLSTFKAVSRALTSLIRNVTSYTPPAELVTGILVHIKGDLDSGERQLQYFAMMRAVVTRNAKLPVVGEIMTQVKEVLVQSHMDENRKSARETLLEYLKTCSNHSKELLKAVTFLLHNLDYKFETGMGEKEAGGGLCCSGRGEGGRNPLRRIRRFLS